MVNHDTVVTCSEESAIKMWNLLGDD